MSWFNKLMDKLGYIHKEYVFKNYVFSSVYEDNLKDLKELKSKTYKQVQHIHVLDQQTKNLKTTNSKLLKENDNLRILLKNQTKALEQANKDIIGLKANIKKRNKNETRLLNQRKELQDELNQHQKALKLMAAYQDRLERLIDVYRYGWTPAYTESLKPRTVVETVVKLGKNNV